MSKACVSPSHQPMQGFSNTDIQLLESSIELEMITAGSEEDHIPIEIKEISKENAQQIQHVQIMSLSIKPRGEVLIQNSLSSENAIKDNTQEFGSVAFVTRRVGCQLCRLQALSLHLVASKYPEALDGFGLFGLVKEVNVDVNGLYEFQNKYFPYPLYHDPSKAYYKALGNRKMGIKNLKKVMNPFSKIWKTVRANKIEGNLLGEGFLQGGIIIFDAEGQPVHTYEEQTAEDLPVAGIVATLNLLRQRQQ